MDTRKRARCTGKVKHPSKGKAEAALRALKRLEPDADMQVYPCPFVARGSKIHWHLGHSAAGNPKNKYRKGAGSAKKNTKKIRD